LSGRFEIYRWAGYRSVAGWLRTGTLTIIKVLNSAQRSKNISGGVAEIGVHHGKLFIGLSLLQREDEHSVAIDLFGDQELNIDKSGLGDLEHFRQNLERWSSLDRVAIHQGDSTRLTPAEVCALAESNIRLFSVDGGHTDEIVFSDMKLAEGALCSGGIVIADDVFNEWWPGVASGTLRYMREAGSLQPFAVGFNKVFFSSQEYTDFYRTTLARYLYNRYPLVAKTAEMSSHEVLVVGRDTPRPRALMRRSNTARTLYHRIRPDRVPSGGDEE
jgi:hypothetical protein